MNNYEWEFYLFRIFIVYSLVALFMTASVGWFISYFLKKRFFSQKMIGKIIGWWLVVWIGIGIAAGIDLLKVTLDLNCFSDDIPMVREWCEKYAKKHNGVYPTYGCELNLKVYYSDKTSQYLPEKLIIGSKNKLLTCSDTGKLYEWPQKSSTVNDPLDTMLFWCGKPHKGFFIKWRNVGFIGGIRQVPEKEFQKLLKEQQGSVKSK